MNTEIKSGQVYIEDRGAGRSPLTLHIVTAGYNTITYRVFLTSSPRVILRRRFEACIKAGLFSLMAVVEQPKPEPDRRTATEIQLMRDLEAKQRECQGLTDAWKSERAARVSAENEARRNKSIGFGYTATEMNCTLSDLKQVRAANVCLTEELNTVIKELNKARGGLALKDGLIRELIRERGASSDGPR